MATGHIWAKPKDYGIEELHACWRSSWGKYGHSVSTKKSIQYTVLEVSSINSIFGQGSIGYLFGEDGAILVGIGPLLNVVTLALLRQGVAHLPESNLV